MSNNAYDDGMGRVPLKDFAGNAVQPAATVGSYSVTNETPIGPPASLRAEAGDGRVRLVWTAPAGVDLETTSYQMRHAAGASVPVDTGWTETNSIENLTALLSGLANGTPHTFEVRAVRERKSGCNSHGVSNAAGGPVQHARPGRQTGSLVRHADGRALYRLTNWSD